MHYNSLRYIFVQPSEVQDMLVNNLITREVIIDMMADGVKISPIPNYTREEMVRWIYHELVHLHLRRQFDAMINDSAEEIHHLISQEAEKMAEMQPLSPNELLGLLKIS